VKHLTWCEFQFIRSELADIKAALAIITSQGLSIMTDLTNITTAVANETTVDQSAITLLNSLSAQIASLKNDPVALQALADSLTTNSTALAAAVAANTPAAPTPAP
jgi:hypothetical protein